MSVPLSHWLAVTAGKLFSVFPNFVILHLLFYSSHNCVEGKPQFLFAHAVYCKLLMKIFSWICTCNCACTHFGISAKIHSFCKWSLRSAFTKDDISTWLSWNFFYTHKTDKLTVLSSELCQPQDRYKINASRIFFSDTEHFSVMPPIRIKRNLL